MSVETFYTFVADVRVMFELGLAPDDKIYVELFLFFTSY